MRFKFTILFLVSILLFSACRKTETQPVASADAKRYPLKGVVIAADKAKKKATIKHEEIPGYMEPMTMDFSIREDWVWEDLTKDAEIRAELVVDDASGDYWLENIGIVAASSSGNPAPPVNENFAQIGNPIPAFSLINQDGKKISPKDFEGKALAITFIYSRCPLPEYCILMSKNFSDLALQINGDAGLKDKMRLLSISFDPATDTPEKLRQYGQGYLGKDAKSDFTVWQLATGTDKEVKEIADFFGLLYEVDQNDKTQFNHSLRTVVVAPDGKVQKIFAGQDWTTAQLLSEMQKTLKN